MADKDTKAKVEEEDRSTKPKEEKPKETKEEKVEVEEETEKKAGAKTEEKTETKVEEKTEDKQEPVKDKESADKEEKPSEEIVPELTNEYRLPTASEQRPLGRKNLKKIMVAVLIILALALAGAAALWVTHDDPVSEQESEIIYYQGAAVTAIEGTAEFNSGTGWNTVGQGTQLEEGYSLRTLEGSRAIITLDEGSAIRLDSDTVVTLTKLQTDEVTIDNIEGQVYTRVVPSETRVFVVTVADQNYQSVGTAYKTVNYDEEKGVEVYQSTVEVKDKTKVKEGETYFTETKDDSKKDKVAELDLEKLKDDDFLKWNKTKDEAESEFADKLGVLKDLDEEKEEKKEDETPVETPSAPTGITATAVKTEDGIKVTWTINGVSITEGYKVAFSKNDPKPTYGENSAKFVSKESSSVVLGLYDGKTYFIRVCAYRGDGVCDNYSDTVTAAAPTKKVTNGTITASLAGDGHTLNWSYTGEAPFGYKVNWNTTGLPKYGESGTQSKLVTWGTSLDLNEKITEAGDYFVTVCAYTSGTESEPCVDYTADINFTRL